MPKHGNTNITNALVRKLKPAEKPYEVRDAGMKGFLLRIQSTGAMTYYFEYTRGKRIRIGVGGSHGLSPDAAREAAAQILAEHAKAKVGLADDPIASRKRIQSDNYLHFLDEHYKPRLAATLRNGVNNEKNVKETIANLKNGFPELHKLGLSDITPHVIDRWHQRRRQDVTKKGKGISPARIKRQLNDLSACLNKAVKWGALASNPFDKVDTIKSDSSAKIRYLSTEEETKMRATLRKRDADTKAGRQTINEQRAKRGYPLLPDLSGLDFVDHLEPAVLLSLNTGMRRGELLNLKWSDVDLEQKNVTVTGDTAKSGKTRHIQLNEESITALKKWKQQGKIAADGAVTVLAEWKNKGKEAVWVFHGPDGQPFHDMNTSFRGLLKKAEIVEFRWHDLRHTFASKLVMAGVDLNTVRELLGHSDIKMTLRYAHLAPKHKQEAVDKLVPSPVAASAP